jgi:segregation and condensation protein B
VADTLQPQYVIEAALLTSPQPLTLEELGRLFAGTLTQTQLLEALSELSEHWKERGLRLVESAGGWGFVTTTDVGEYLIRMSEQKMPKYSRAVMETLAIIAYRQPVTRGDIEDIRGVAVNPNVVRQLQERGWIEIVGHRETPGRPGLFATTRQFLDDLGLKSLSDLPHVSGDIPASKEFELVFGEDKTEEDGQEQQTSEADAAGNEKPAD